MAPSHLGALSAHRGAAAWSAPLPPRRSVRPTLRRAPPPQSPASPRLPALGCGKSQRPQGGRGGGGVGREVPPAPAGFLSRLTPTFPPSTPARGSTQSMIGHDCNVSGTGAAQLSNLLKQAILIHNKPAKFYIGMTLLVLSKSHSTQEGAGRKALGNRVSFLTQVRPN